VVRGVITQNEIAVPIVRADPVYVMHLCVSRERLTEDPFGYHDVFVDVAIRVCSRMVG
jgi:hypothetical protein